MLDNTKAVGIAIVSNKKVASARITINNGEISEGIKKRGGDERSNKCLNLGCLQNIRRGRGNLKIYYVYNFEYLKFPEEVIHVNDALIVM